MGVKGKGDPSRIPSRWPRRRAVFLTAVLLFLPACSPESNQTILISGALVADGSGAEPSRAAVRIRGDRIEAVGELKPLRGEEIVEADGLVLAPGFIDTHSHADLHLADHPGALGMVSQGVTTAIIGQDGGSPFPLGSYFEELAAAPSALNIASFAGHNTLRSEVMGEDFRRAATAEDVEAMGELLRREMAAGALGLSSGLEYDPGIYAATEEVLALSQIAADFGGRYISHLRSEDRHLETAIEEILEIGRRTSMPVQISHFKLAMRGLWGEAGRILERLDRARRQGIEVTADVYPYTYWQSTLTVLLPERRFDDREAAAFALAELAPPEGLLLSRFDPEPNYVGKTVLEIAELRGVDPVTCYLDLIAAAEAMRLEDGEGHESVIGTSMSEEDVLTLLRWPHSNLSTDGALIDRHPRGRGTYPKVLGRLVRQQGALSMGQAIHKMTGLAARHMGLQDRGRIAPGAFADLVLFDPETILDRATPEDPDLLAVGIERVWVNGVEVYADGTVTGARPGRALRRAPGRLKAVGFVRDRSASAAPAG